MEALEQISEMAKEHETDLLTIRGYLLDSVRDAVLRHKLRELFRNDGFPIIAIPGNHDREVYSKDKDFGQDLEIWFKADETWRLRKSLVSN